MKSKTSRFPRIGLTMRVVKTVEYYELRDALAQDWIAFMSFALPECSWMPIPNIGNNVSEYIKFWSLDGVIMTGGNDIGENKIRDETEKAILKYAHSEELPIFGVCRGMQFIHHVFGGNIVACSPDIHSGKNHGVIFTEHVDIKELAGKEVTVNSYHKFGLHNNDLTSDTLAIAVAKDGFVEGLKFRDNRITAVMWHPERDKPFRNYDRCLIRNSFGLSL